VGRRQRHRIRRAVDYYLAHNPRLAGLAVRFDLMLVAHGGWPRHVAGAWQPD
jgi:Holliday junction resolvase-like predicted endonuclease